jgi:hypothetical protein
MNAACDIPKRPDDLYDGVRLEMVDHYGHGLRQSEDKFPGASNGGMTDTAFQ